MNKPTSWQVCKQVNINWASDISLSMCAYLLACSHRPHSRLLVSIWPSNKVYHSHWLWASQQATRNYTSVTAYICIILHTQKAPFELFRKSTVKEGTWLNWTSDNGWLTPVLQTPALCCLQKVTKLPRNIQNNKKKISSSCLILGSGGSSDSDWVQRPLIFRLEDFRFDARSRNNRGWRSPFSSSPGGIYGACASSCTTHGSIKLRMIK